MIYWVAIRKINPQDLLDAYTIRPGNYGALNKNLLKRINSEIAGNF